MSLINDALKKAQRDRETAANGDPAPPTPEGPAPQPPAPRVGPRPGNPAATRTFRWTRRIIGVTLAAAGTTAAVLFLLVLIRPTPEPEFVPPREMAVHIKIPQPAATAPPANDPAASTSPTGSNAAAAAIPSPTAPADTQTAPTQPATSPAPAQEPGIAFKIQADEGETPTADAQPPAGTTTEPTPAPANTVASAPAPTKDATPPTPPDTAPSVATSEPGPSTPADANAPAQEGPLPIAFAMPEQPVTVAATETANPDEAPAEMSSPGAEGDPAVLAFLNASRIAGVKVAGKQSRVLMNNQVFFVGSVVDPNTRLRIKAIENSEIEFIDESGLEYRKRFQR